MADEQLLVAVVCARAMVVVVAVVVVVHGFDGWTEWVNDVDVVSIWHGLGESMDATQPICVWQMLLLSLLLLLSAAVVCSNLVVADVCGFVCVCRVDLGFVCMAKRAYFMDKMWKIDREQTHLQLVLANLNWNIVFFCLLCSANHFVGPNKSDKRHSEIQTY